MHQKHPPAKVACAVVAGGGRAAARPAAAKTRMARTTRSGFLVRMFALRFSGNTYTAVRKDDGKGHAERVIFPANDIVCADELADGSLPPRIRLVARGAQGDSLARAP